MSHWLDCKVAHLWWNLQIKNYSHDSLITRTCYLPMDSPPAHKGTVISYYYTEIVSLPVMTSSHVVILPLFVPALIIGIACGCFLTNYRDWFVKYDHALPAEAVVLGWAFWMAVVVCLLLLTSVGMLVPDTYANSREEAKPKKDPRLPYDL